MTSWPVSTKKMVLSSWKISTIRIYLLDRGDDNPGPSILSGPDVSQLMEVGCQGVKGCQVKISPNDPIVTIQLLFSWSFYFRVSPCFTMFRGAFWIWTQPSRHGWWLRRSSQRWWLACSFNPNIGRLQPSPMLELYSISSKPSKVAVVNTPWSDTNKYPQKVQFYL